MQKVIHLKYLWIKNLINKTNINMWTASCWVGRSNVHRWSSDWPPAVQLRCRTLASGCFRCWRGVQEGDQGHPDCLRPVPAGCWPTSLRAKEVRWPWCPCSLPEVIPINHCLNIMLAMNMGCTIKITQEWPSVMRGALGIVPIFNT